MLLLKMSNDGVSRRELELLFPPWSVSFTDSREIRQLL